MRTFNLLKYLRQRHAIALVTQREANVTDAEIAELREYVDDLVVFQRPVDVSAGSIGKKLQRLGNFLLQGTPPSVLNRYSDEMDRWINNYVQAGKCDVITCEHSVNEVYIKADFKRLVRTVVNVHSSIYGTCRNQLQTGTSENPVRDRINLPLLRRYEQDYCAKFAAVVATTNEDKIQLEKFTSKVEVSVITNGVDLAAFPYRAADPHGHRLIFIGAMDNLANIDAVCFFCRDILPKIQEKYPETSFDIVGSRPTSEVLALNDIPGVNVIGHVPSMGEYLHRSTVCVIPMRTGFGIKNKTLEAMAAGIPVVASDRGLEGLIVDGLGIPLRALRANLVGEYLTAISQLFDDAQLRAELSINGRRLVENEFTWEVAGQLYEQVCLAR